MPENPLFRVRSQRKNNGAKYLVVFDDRSVGVIKELIDAPEEDEGWDVPRVDLDHFIVGV